MTGKRPRCFLGRFRRSYSGRDGIGRERKAVFPRLVRSLSFRILRHGKRTVPAGSPFAGAAIGFSPIPFRPNGIGKGGGSALFPFDGWSMPVRCSGRPLSPYATHRRSGWPFPNPASVLSDHGPRMSALLSLFLRSRRCRPKSAAARLLFILRNKSSPFGRPFFEAGNPKARKRFRPEGDSPRRVALRPNRFSGRNYPQAGKPAGLSPVRKVRIIFSGSSTPRSFWAGRCCPSRR